MKSKSQRREQQHFSNLISPPCYTSVRNDVSIHQVGNLSEIPLWRPHLTCHPDLRSMLDTEKAMDFSATSCRLTGTELDSDLNSVVMDYLVSEGYPSAAQKFASEANIQPKSGYGTINERVEIRDAIWRGDIQTAIEMINELDPTVSLTTCTLPIMHVIRCCD